MQTRHLLSAVFVSSTLAFAAPALARTPPADDPSLLPRSPAGAEVDQNVSRNAAACLPDAPEPVWSRDGRLLGYRCVGPNANGA